MSAFIADWLVDTFIYTAVLIAAVLLLRRPVSRHFGPQVAYALWALPLLRLVMPPLVLPAWMAPAQGSTATAAEPLMILVSDAPSAGAAPVLASAPQVGIGLVDMLLSLWLGGTALFLFWRWRSYVTMRRELLAEARPVGEAGRIRLVETPAVTSPLAFGVLDKVVALPQFFMAHADRDARDLAIAHELAHHRGHDLLANILAQPLLALHWFNPLAWAGWRAMRRDQEAACDARVIAGRGRNARAHYASVIAGFAAGDNRLALAAPMACPVLGEKSIIHRLRSLAASEVSSGRRRAGLLAIGAAALGLPLTASISYAAPAPPEPPAAPTAPAPPSAPAAPLAPRPLENIGPDADHRDHAEGDGPIRRERTIIVRRVGPEGIAPDGDDESDSERFEARIEAHERALEAMEQGLAERERAIEEAGEAREKVLSQVRVVMREAPRVSTQIACEGDEPVIERELEDGRRAIVICKQAITSRAVEGLREARNAIARENDMPNEQRERILRQLDEQIERMAGQRVSVSLRYEFRPAPDQVSPAAAVMAVGRSGACPSTAIA